MLQRRLATAIRSPGKLSGCPFFQEKGRKGSCSGVGKGWTMAQLAGKAGGEVRSQQRDPRGPEETGDKDRAPWQQPQERLTSIQDYP